MNTVSLTIDEVGVKADKGSTVLEAARKAGIYIPSLCSHPDLTSSQETPPKEVIYRKSQAIKGNSSRKFEGCQLCIVEIKGMPGFSASCNTIVSDGMVVNTATSQVQELRRRNLSAILADHPHACLTCAQMEGCAREPCSLKTPVSERCCPLLGRCELQKVAKYVGISMETPRYKFADIPVTADGPLFKRNYNLCINCLRCVRVCKDVRGIEALGFVWHDNKAIVGTIAPSIEDSGCKFCGACVEVCPTGALTDIETRWSGEALVRCKENCPAGIDVPRYVRHIADGEFAEALDVITEKVPFPLTLGHVCFHPCESECRRGDVNQPIAICDLKRFAAEHKGNRNHKVAPSTHKRVAIVGSGPAGLTAAYYLAKLGHSVTVFESLPVAGGMMAVGIPSYRLGKDILKAEIDSIRALGVEIKTNTRISGSDDLQNLASQGYQATFLAVGAHRNNPMEVEGEHLKGVVSGIDFLREVNLGKKVDIGQRIAVIGGGNVAIDAARTARRLGAKDVMILYRRSRQEMPAAAEEIEEAEEEGIKISYLTAPQKIIGKDGRAHAIECIKMELTEPDESGRRKPVPLKGSEFKLDIDTVIPAIGQSTDVSFLGADSRIEVTNKSTFKVDQLTLATNVPGVFAGGDAVLGPASVIEAIAAGRKAAISIDKYLGGAGNIDNSPTETAKYNPWIGREEGFASKPRTRMSCLEAKDRLKGFTDVKLGFTKEQAIKEAARCLQCDLRLQISPPVTPPEKETALEFSTEKMSSVPKTGGVIQLFDEKNNTIYIAGTMNLHDALEELFSSNESARSKGRYFQYEENDMYTTRENELIQQFMHEHGGLPELNDDGLF